MPFLNSGKGDSVEVGQSVFHDTILIIHRVLALYALTQITQLEILNIPNLNSNLIEIFGEKRV